jgi:hypothetical protein
MGWFWKSKPKAPVRMCPSGHVMEGSWLACPYCPPPARAPERVSANVAPAATVSRASGPTAGRAAGGDPGKTVFLPTAKKPPVVGWLIALDGKHKGEDFKIVEGKNKLGKNADCEVVLTDDFISGEHALIYYERDEKHFLITDTGSTNGTYVYEGGEYKKITSRELLDNDTVKVGETQLRFKCLG